MSFHTVTVFTLIFCAVTTWHHIFKAWTKLSVVSLSHFIHIVLLSHQVHELQHVCTKQTALISADKRSFIVFFKCELITTNISGWYLFIICSSAVHAEHKAKFFLFFQTGSSFISSYLGALVELLHFFSGSTLLGCHRETDIVSFSTSTPSVGENIEMWLNRKKKQVNGCRVLFQVKNEEPVNISVQRSLNVGSVVSSHSVLTFCSLCEHFKQNFTQILEIAL